MRRVYFALFATVLAAVASGTGPPIQPRASTTYGGLRAVAASTNWTGYVLLSRQNRHTYFTQVEAQWTVQDVPNVYSDGVLVSGVATWIGLGGTRRSSVLWQAGTGALPCEESYTVQYDNTSGATGSLERQCTAAGCVDASFLYGDGGSWQQTAATDCNSYRFLYEDYGCTAGAAAPCPNAGYPVYVDYPTIKPGDRVYVKVYLNGRVYFGNLTTGQSATYTIAIDNNNSGLSAEWITEEGCAAVLQALGPCLHPMSFPDPQFGGAYAYGTTMSTYLDIFNYTRVDLRSPGGQLLAEPPVPDKTTHGFSVTCC